MDLFFFIDLVFRKLQSSCEREQGEIVSVFGVAWIRDAIEREQREKLHFLSQYMSHSFVLEDVDGRVLAFGAVACLVS
jgi:hypothetical protein